MFRERMLFPFSISALVALFLGLITTAILFVSVRHLEHDRTRLDFQQHAELRVAAIAEGLVKSVEVLQTINQFFAAVESVTPEQFHIFTAPLLGRYPYIQTLSYQRILSAGERSTYEARMRETYPDFAVTEMAGGKLVAAGDRARYSVVEYIEPKQGNETALGLDLLPELSTAKAMQLAGTTVLASSAGLTRFVQENIMQSGFAITIPLYRRETAVGGDEAHRFAAIGNATAVLRAGDLVNQVLAAGGFLHRTDIDVSLYAGDTLDERDLVFHTGAGTRSKSDDGWLPQWLLWDRIDSVSKTLEIGGRPGHLRISAAPVLFTENHTGSLFVLIIGVLSSILTGMRLQGQASGVQRIRRRADERLMERHAGKVPDCDDKAARVRYEAELEFHANHDTLTGLASSNLLDDRLGQALAYAERYGHQVWIVCIDLDRFKFVNDTLGHKSGDLVLRLVSERLQNAVREMDTVARLGGDKFVLVLSEASDEKLSSTAVQRLMDAVAPPFRLEGYEFFLTCSIGIAIYPADGADPETLIKHADIAMYRAKELRGNNFQFYTEGMNARALERLRIEGALRTALERNEFLLHYQPQVDLRTGRVVGMEALLRWQHPELGMIPPVRFIGLAEEIGLIVPIGAWVMRAACIQNKAWQDAGLGHLRVAVNLSARQFYQENLVASVAAMLEETGLEPAFLEIELTESMVMTDVERTIGILRGLKELGVHLSIDDFGTGYSSLSYLKRFPIDLLKIDQSFVRDITIDPDDAAIVTSIISLAHSLRLCVTAEGVETAAQLAYLQRHGCDLIQGYYFSTPMPASGFAQLLRQGKCLLANSLLEKEGRETLLIVDDESNILSALKRLLHKDGYHILTAQTPTEALELLALHDVQVVVSDQRMPSISGIEFLSKVKELHPDIVRIILSGYAELEAVIDAINHGAAYRFFTKPWDDEVLRSNIRGAFRHYWLQRGAQRPASPNDTIPVPVRYEAVG